LKVVFTRLAHQDLVRLRQFIAEHAPNAAARAAKRIKTVAQLLTDQPLVGRPVDAPNGAARNDIRELPLTFGSGGYVLRYQVLQKQIRVLRIWHAREERK
jgi:plasmid stabilization system protein ParE